MTDAIVQSVVVEASREKLFSLPDRPGHELQVDFTVDELGGGRSRVTVAHSGWSGLDELRRRHDSDWAHSLGCLRDVAEGRPVEKSFDSS